MEITGQGAVAPRRYQEKYQYPDRNGLIFLLWSNFCEGRYGTYEELITIIEALERVITVQGVMQPEYQNRGCQFDVFRDMGPGVERLLVGGGSTGVVTGGTHVGNEVE